jgi:hypothetical protein
LTCSIMASLIDVVEECVWVETAVVSIVVLRFGFCFAGRQLAGPANLHCQKRNLHRQKHGLYLIPSPVQKQTHRRLATPPIHHRPSMAGWNKAGRVEEARTSGSSRAGAAAISSSPGIKMGASASGGWLGGLRVGLRLGLLFCWVFSGCSSLGLSPAPILSHSATGC